MYAIFYFAVITVWIFYIFFFGRHHYVYGFHVITSKCSAYAIKFRTFTIIYNRNSSPTVIHNLFCLNLSSHKVYWPWINWPLFIVRPQPTWTNFDVLLTVLHLSIFISVTDQLDAQNFCLTIRLFHACTCFEHMCSSSVGQNCITQPLVSSHL